MLNYNPSATENRVFIQEYRLAAVVYLGLFTVSSSSGSTAFQWKGLKMLEYYFGGSLDCLQKE